MTRPPFHRVRVSAERDTVVQVDRCRCGAWRAHVRLDGRTVVTDWSDPCSVPSPALPHAPATR